MLGSAGTTLQYLFNQQIQKPQCLYSCAVANIVGYIVAGVCEEASQEVSNLIMSGDHNPSCGARQGTFYIELRATDIPWGVRVGDNCI